MRLRNSSPANITQTLQASLRAALFLTILVAPMAGFAASLSSDGAGNGRGAGFVLYVSLMRAKG